MHSLPGREAHFVLEMLAYFVGARLYWAQARRQPRPAAWIDRMALVAGAVFGAALGSKLLHVFEHLPFLLAQGTPELWLGGKSVLGGFIGGTLGVEIAKRLTGWRTPTGDAWVPALAAGLMIGRVGCQLSGLWDQTFGIPTTLPWGWDYGDGIARHPTAAYEILLLAGLYLGLRGRFTATPGARFATFLAGYCVIRLGLECLKPPFGPAPADTLPVALYAGLTAIQWAALSGLAGYVLMFVHRLRGNPAPAPA
jgi:prolipoprotein diacylglyceryltransferase